MAHSQTSVSFHTPATLPPPVGYSHIVKIHSGTLVVLSGQMARNVSGDLIGEGDFRAQLEQVFANLNNAVHEAGGTFNDIIKLNYFCVDSVSAEDQRNIVPVRDQYVNIEAPPASTFVGVSRLARPEWLIEIEAWAVIPDGGHG